MKAGWECHKLGDVCRIDKNQGYHEGLPYVGMEHIESDTARFLGSLKPTQVKSATFRFSNVHLLYGRLRPYLNKVLEPEFDGHCSTEILPICPSTGVARTYLKYWFLSDETVKRINATCTGSRMPRADISDVLQLPIQFPPLPEQHRIVKILDEAFENIATAKANADKNLQNARALFESHLQDVFGTQNSWSIVKIGDVACVFDGPHATPRTVDDGPVFLGISSLVDGKVNLAETRHVTPDDFVVWTRRVKPQAGDVVFSYETRLGQAAVIPDGLECCLGRRMGLIRPDRTKLDERFLTYQYVSPPFRAFLETRTIRGATVDRISIKEFPTFPILLPPLSAQEKVAQRIEDTRAETRRLESIYQAKIAALDELKKSLLHQAFNGDL